jgi:hypothetical protein
MLFIKIYILTVLYSCNSCLRALIYKIFIKFNSVIITNDSGDLPLGAGALP